MLRIWPAGAAPLLALLALLALRPATAEAHATLVRAEPAPGAQLARPPARVVLWFSEPLIPSLSSARVLGPDGQRVEAGPSAVADTDAQRMEVPLPGLADGTYTVVWTSVSPLDGHILRGSFRFTVGSPTGEAAATAEAAVPSGLDLAGQGGLVGVAARWAGLLGSLSWVGVLLASLLAAGRLPAAAASHFAARTTVLATGAVALTLLAGVVEVLAQAWALGEGSPARAVAALRPFLLGSRYGLATVMRLAYALLGQTILGWRGGRDAGRHELRVAALALGALALGALAFSGHAAAVEYPSWSALLLDWVHLLAAAAWVGGVVAIALALLPSLADLTAGERRWALISALSAFSPVALAAVAALVVTGLFSAEVQLGSFDRLATTPYGRVLLVKIVLVAAMVGISYWHAFVLRPRLAAHAPGFTSQTPSPSALEKVARLAARTSVPGPPGAAMARQNPGDDPKRAAALEAKLGNWLRFEAGLGVLVVLAVALLNAFPLTPGAAAPTPAEALAGARQPPGAAPPSGAARPAGAASGDRPTIVLAQSAGPLAVTLALARDEVGPNQLELELRDPGSELVDVAAVQLRVTGPPRPEGASGAPIELAPERAARGRYRASVLLDRPGRWQVAVAIDGGRTLGPTFAPGPWETTFSLPLPTTDAAPLLTLAEQAMNRLQSVREVNRLGPTWDGQRWTDKALTTVYELAAPDRMRFRIETGVEAVIIGQRRWDWDPDTRVWQAGPYGGLQPFRFPTYSYIKNAEDVRLLGTEELDGRTVLVLGYYDAAFGARFQLWVDAQNFLVRRELMIATGHHMLSEFVDFNAPVEVQPPT